MDSSFSYRPSIYDPIFPFHLLEASVFSSSPDSFLISVHLLGITLYFGSVKTKYWEGAHQRILE